MALFTAGVGTLLFQICTRGKVPIFLASSFAFIAPIIYGVQTWGIPQTLGGLVCSGLVYFILSGLIRWRGTEVVLRLLPPIVTGPVIMVIGLILAPVAVNMALGKTGDGSAVLVPENTALWISMSSLLVTVLVSLLGRGFLKLMPYFVRHCSRFCRFIDSWHWRLECSSGNTLAACAFVYFEFSGTHTVYYAHYFGSGH